jgi:RNA recognition motif-containing protein
MYDPQSQRPRGFGFIVFATEEALQACVSIPNHEIASKFVEV